MRLNSKWLLNESLNGLWISRLEGKVARERITPTLYIK